MDISSDSQLVIVSTVEKQILSLNGKRYEMKDGTLQVNIIDLIIPKEKGLAELDRILENMLTIEQRIELYDLFLRSSRFGQGDVRSLLLIDRIQTKQILTEAFRNHIIRRLDTQYKIESDKRSSIEMLIRTLKIHLHGNDDEEPKLEALILPKSEKPAKTNKKKREE